MLAAAAPAAASPGRAAAEVAAALRLELDRAGPAADPAIAAFYRRRGYKPIWAPGELRPEAIWLAGRLSGRSPRLADRVAAAGVFDPARLAQLELQLSTAYADAAAGRLRGGPGRTFAFVDPELAADSDRRAREALREAASAPDLQARLQRALGMRNPFEAALEETLTEYRATWGKLPATPTPLGAELRPSANAAAVAALRVRLGLPQRGTYDPVLADRVTAFQRTHGLPPTGVADIETLRALNRGPVHYQRLLEANLERARALPADLGDRFILVDAAGGELRYYDHGQVRAAMRVVVGKPSQPTPMMVGLLRYVMLNPYWNVPDDLVRTSIAPKVLARGLSYVEEDGLLVLSDYSDTAVPLDPAHVDWRAVARGDLRVRVRQRPGPRNMMGQVKLMLPNPLGIYLHDTPIRDSFSRSQRLESAGCVRLEDAMRLTRLLADERQVARALDRTADERRVDLKAPIPVYITYFTAEPTADGVVVRPDVYGLDSRRLAARVGVSAAR